VRSRLAPSPKLTARQRRVRHGLRKLAWGAAIVLALGLLVYGDRRGLFGYAPKGDYQKYHNQSFTVCRVVDGDTIDLDSPDGQHSTTRVRLWGVDTPETVKENTPVQHFGPEASRFTKSLVLEQTVRVELEPTQTRDKYGRLLAYVYLPDGRMLNRVLVAEGYGYADPRYEHTHKAQFARLQTQAMEARAGLWKDLRNDDLPYYYRDRLKLETPNRECPITHGMSAGLVRDSAGR